MKKLKLNHKTEIQNINEQNKIQIDQINILTNKKCL